MTDDERRKKRAEAARRRRRDARSARESALQAVTPPKVALWPPLSRDALEQHAAQLSAYLIELHTVPGVTLEAKVRLVAYALPSLARAVDSTYVVQRLEDLEREVMRLRGIRSVA